MINLLPPEQKEKLLLETKGKVAMVLGITMAIPLICLVLFLVSTYFYILIEAKSRQIILEEAQRKYQTHDFLVFKELIQKNNRVLGQIEPFYKKELPVSSVLQLVSLIPRPPKLYISDLVLQRNEDKKIKAMLTGFSASREDLLAFKEAVEKNEEIKNPSFSPESWVSPKDITFYVTFEVLPNEK